MKYEVFFKDAAKRFIEKLDNSQRVDVIKKIEKLAENPNLGVPLVGNLSGFWKLRVSKYRVIYEIRDSELIVFVVAVGHRKNVYD